MFTSTIKRLLNVERLNKELAEKEAEIAYLKGRVSGPSFRSVAKEFDASELFDAILQEAKKELIGVVQEDFVRMLVEAERCVSRKKIRGYIAEVYPDMYAVELVIRHQTTRIQVAKLY